mgnify:CR=1 FL=1
MKQRLLVAAVGVPALLVILLALPPFATTVLVCLIAGIAAYELLHTAAKQPRPIVYVLTIACALVCVWNAELSEIVFPIAAFLLLTALCLIAVLTHGKENAMPFSDVSLCMLAGVVFPVMYSCIAYLRQTGRVLVLMPFVIAFVGVNGLVEAIVCFFTGAVIAKAVVFSSGKLAARRTAVQNGK